MKKEEIRNLGSNRATNQDPSYPNPLTYHYTTTPTRQNS